MTHPLTGIAVAALLGFAAPAWAQAPLSPSASRAAGAAAPAAPPGTPPPAATVPPPAANAAPEAQAATAPQRRPRRRTTRVQIDRYAAMHPQGVSDNIANQLNAQELARLNEGPTAPPEGAPGYPPAPYPGPGYYPPSGGYPPSAPPGYPPPPWSYGPPPY